MNNLLIFWKNFIYIYHSKVHTRDYIQTINYLLNAVDFEEPEAVE